MGTKAVIGSKSGELVRDDARNGVAGGAAGGTAVAVGERIEPGVQAEEIIDPSIELPYPAALLEMATRFELYHDNETGASVLVERRRRSSSVKWLVRDHMEDVADRYGKWHSESIGMRMLPRYVADTRFATLQEAWQLGRAMVTRMQSRVARAKAVELNEIEVPVKGEQ